MTRWRKTRGIYEPNSELQRHLRHVRRRLPPWSKNNDVYLILNSEDRCYRLVIDYSLSNSLLVLQVELGIIAYHSSPHHRSNDSKLSLSDWAGSWHGGDNDKAC